MNRIFKTVSATLAATVASASGAMAAGAIEGGGKQALNIEAIVMFGLFVLFTLGITKWAASRNKSAADF